MSVRDSSRSGAKSTFPIGPLVVFSLLYLLVSIVLLPLLPIGGSSEAREAKVIDVIVSTGEWVLPLRNGVIPSKPPLFHWIGAALASVGGFVSEFDARLPSILTGLVAFWLVTFVTFRFLYLSSRAIYRNNASSGALLAAAILSLTYGFYQMSTMAMVDMVFTMFVWAALAGLASTTSELWQEDRQVTPVARFLFWLGCAFAVVARGPVGTVVPVVIACAVGVSIAGFSKTLRLLFTPSPGWLCFLIPLAWYLAASQQGGEAFIDRQLVFENMRRIVGGEHMNNEAWWYYLPSLIRTTFPWWLLCLLLLPQVLPTFGSTHESGTSKLDTRILPLVCFLAGVILFSIPSGKRHSYMLPLYPFLAMQVAILMIEAVQKGGFAGRIGCLRAIQSVGSVVVFASAMLAGGLGLISENIGPMSPLRYGLQPFFRTIAFPATVVLLVGALPVLISKDRPLELRLIRMWHGLFVLMATVICVGLGVKSSIKDYPGLARRIAHAVPEGFSVSVVKDPFDEYFDPVLFYLRRDIKIVDINSVDLECSDRVMYLARAVVLDAALPRYKGKISPIKTFREFGDDVRGVSAREIVGYRCDPFQAPDPPLIPSGSTGVVAQILSTGCTKIGT